MKVKQELIDLAVKSGSHQMVSGSCAQPYFL